MTVGEEFEIIPHDVELALCCYHCDTKLALFEDICLYYQNPSTTHMAIKPERMKELKSNFNFGPQLNPKRIKFSPFTISCYSCGLQVGIESIVGPSGESLYCFLTTQSYVKNPFLGKYQKNWLEVTRVVSGIETRSPETFYGNSIENEDTSEFPAKLSTESRLRTFIPIIGNVAVDAIQLFQSFPLKPRCYQLECFSASISRNSIIYLPTGTGKTLIAALVMAYMKNVNPQKLVLFLVDRVPLVFQQGEYLKSQTGLSLLLSCGEINDGRQRDIYTYDGICCTVQILLNYLHRKIVKIEDFSCIVFDEIHHASKNHPYSVLLKDHITPLPKLYQPLILGLTASPAVGSPIEMLARLDSLCILAGNAAPYTPLIYFDELQLLANRPKLVFVEAEPSSPDENRLFAFLKILVNLLLKKFYSLLQIDEDTSSLEMSDIRSIVRKLVDVAHSRKNDLAVRAGNYLQQSLSIYEMISILGCRYANCYLLDLFKQFDIGFWTHEEQIRLEEFQADLEKFNPPENSGKAHYLLHILRHEILANEGSRTIVFVQTKKTARWLCDLLRNDQEVNQKWNPMYFVGQGQCGDLDGMSWADQQEPILNLFREGTVRLLVSTSVLQEGLDVPDCDNVILFDRSWTLTNFVQSRGRARSRVSRYTLICSPLDRQFYEDLIRSEHTMHQIIIDKIALQAIAPRIALSAIHLCQLVQKNWKMPTISGSANPKENYQVFKIVLRNLPNDWNEKEMAPIVLTLLQNCFELVDNNLNFSKLDGLFLGSALETLVKHIHNLLESCRKIISLPLFKDAILQLSPTNLIGPAREEVFYFNALGIEFGCLKNPTDFGQFREVNSFMTKIEINFPLQKIEVVFKFSEMIYRIRIDLAIIDGFITLGISDIETDLSLIIPLKRPPIFMSAHLHDPDVSLEALLPEINSLKWNLESAASIEPVCYEIGQMNTLKLNLLVTPQLKLLLVSVLQSFSLAGFYALVANIKTHKLNLEIGFYRNIFDIELLYSLLALRSSCFTSFNGRVSSDPFKKISKLPPREIDALALKMRGNRFLDWESEVDSLLLQSENPVNLELGRLTSGLREADGTPLSNSCSLKMIILTPTRVIYLQPKLVSRNRVTRAFPDENFIRVQFRDEDLSKLSRFKADALIESSLLRIKYFLVNGFVIGNRRFDFLAMSSSQLREHGCWFVCEFEDPKTKQIINANVIREWMGDFSAIRNASKYVARLGQSLSSSIDAVGIAADSGFMIIPDITSQQNEYNFSDGIGMISKDLAVHVTAKLGLEYQPCAFQIRFAGFKGVVAIDMFPIPGIDLKLRPSMKKFESMHRRLEILNVSGYIPCYLNRQIIMILSGLGVPDESFEILHNEMLLKMATMLNDYVEGRRQLVRHYCPFPKGKLIFSKFACIEPFFRSLIIGIYKKQFSNLLTRSRIFVNSGRILIGTIDETGLLKEDEVFIQCRFQGEEEIDEKRTIVNGDKFVVVSPVCIAKNPCMHPGDVRILRAVFNQTLADVRWDVIVFPAKGNRPITDMCSGSDLDGDLYFVAWDPRIIPPNTDEPMSYNPPPEMKKSSPINVEDVQQFMLEFISNDQLGTIANAHVAHADQKQLGVRDPLCKQLASIFSLAVDFPKTGYVASLPEDAKVEFWPDFMNKAENRSYRSEKIIGKMYRRAKLAFNSELEKCSFPIQLNEAFLIQGREGFTERMRQLYQNYCEQVSRLLALNNISDEAQILTGGVKELSFFGKDDVKDTMEIIGTKYQAVQRRYREFIIGEFQDEKDEIKLKQIASACYFCCYSNPINLFSGGRPILSFPWILGDYLEKIVEESNDFKNDIASCDVYCILAKQLNELFEKPGVISEMLFQYLDRMRVVDAVGGSLDNKFLLVGSTAFFSFGEFSDVNLLCGQSIESVKDAMKRFRILFELKEDQRIVFEVDSYQVVVEYGQSPADIAAYKAYNDWIFGYLSKYWSIAEVLRRWATCFRIIRHGPFHYGKVPTWRLLGMLFKFIEFSGIDKPNPDISQIDWSAMICRVAKATKEQMMILLRFLKFLSFSSVQELRECFLDLIVSSDNWLNIVRESALRGFYLLSQTLDITQLWNNKSSLADDAELAAALNSRKKNSGPQFLRKHGLSFSGYFIRGCSRILYECSNSRRDQLVFDQYNGHRRFPHLDKNCYSPRLLFPNESQSNLFCRSEFFNHLQHQLLSTYKYGGASFGDLKLHMKLGKIYLMHLSKMFIEEVGSATLENVQLALDKCYIKCNVDVKKLHGQDYCDVKLSGKISTISDEELVTSDVNNDENQRRKRQRTLKNGHELIKLVGGIQKTLDNSPMNSAFEPCIDRFNYAKFRQFIEKFEFAASSDDRLREKMERTFSLSIPLLDDSSAAMRDYQILYDDESKNFKGSCQTFTLAYL